MRADRPAARMTTPKENTRAAESRVITHQCRRIRPKLQVLELLVIIAINGILAVILLPSLSKTKCQTGKVTDLNNLK